MRLLHLSDTHNRHRELTDLPAADILIHSGDVSMAGTDAEVIYFIE
jgi:predicted phosphodiesterase